MKSNQRRYLASLAGELDAQATRVRDLIGDAHWYTDGYQKEFLLTGLLQRHLPASTIAARGFVISPSDPDACSREQDILIIDTQSEGPLFYQGGVVMAFPHTVLATISVKTKMGSQEVLSSVQGIASVLNVAVNAVTDTWRIWTGAFFFDESPLETNPARFYDYFARATQEYPLSRPLLNNANFPSIAGDMFASARNLLYVVDEVPRAIPSAELQWRLRGYRCNGLSTAVFLASVLEHIAKVRGGVGTALGDWTDDGSIIPIAESERSFPIPA